MATDDVIASFTISVLADGRIRHEGDAVILLAYGPKEENLPFMLGALGIPEWVQWVTDFRARQQQESTERRRKRAR